MPTLFSDDQSAVDVALDGTNERTERETRAARDLFAHRFGTDYEPGPIADEEEAVVRSILEAVDERFSRMKYVLGTALDFVLLAEALDARDRGFEPDVTQGMVFERHARVTHRGDRELNTLTLTDVGGSEYGIRAIEEAVMGAFHRAMRTDYPKAYVYNSGQWHKFGDLLEAAFSLSKAGRYRAAHALFDYGLLAMAPNTSFAGIARPRLFPQVVEEYRRDGVKGEKGGSVFQGIAYGYFKADRPHLSVEARGSRTGSSRLSRIGDVEGYYGASVEFTAEVKDLVVTEDAFGKELEAFVGEVERSNLRGIVVARDVDEAVEAMLDERGVYLLTQADLLDQLDLWDYAKQDVALYGLLHYLSHVERSQGATQRLLRFVEERDPDHPSLTHLQETRSRPGKTG